MDIDRHDLFELYKVATETDRYELELGWKLVQFFTALNSGLIGLGFTLLGSDQLLSKLYTIPIFSVGTTIVLFTNNWLETFLSLFLLSHLNLSSSEVFA